MLSGLKLFPHHEQIKPESGLSESAAFLISKLRSIHAAYITTVV
jgi:hypothetical protein